MDRTPARPSSWIADDPAYRPAPSLVAALAGEPVRVGTENPAKLAAVRGALSRFVGPDVEAADPDAGAGLSLVPVAVASGVPEQPLGYAQILAGARERARAALAAGVGVLGVGIEDGLVRVEGGGAEGDWLNVGCAWLTDGEREAYGLSSGFAYPTAPLARAVAEQAPIGDLFDAEWAARRPLPGPAESGPSGRAGGNIGRLTGGRLDRAAYGEQAVLCALVRFLHTDLYD